MRLKVKNLGKKVGLSLLHGLIVFGMPLIVFAVAIYDLEQNKHLAEAGQEVARFMEYGESLEFVGSGLDGVVRISCSEGLSTIDARLDGETLQHSSESLWDARVEGKRRIEILADCIVRFIPAETVEYKFVDDSVDSMWSIFGYWFSAMAGLLVGAKTDDWLKKLWKKE